MLQEGEDQSEVVVEQSYRSMLNVVDGSKNFGADNDLKCEATQLGNRAAGQPLSQSTDQRDRTDPQGHGEPQYGP